MIALYILPIVCPRYFLHYVAQPLRHDMLNRSLRGQFDFWIYVPTKRLKYKYNPSRFIGAV